MGAMVEIDQFIEGPLAHQHQGDRADEQGAQAQARENQRQLTGDCKGAHGAIEAEGGIQQLQVDEAGDAAERNDGVLHRGALVCQVGHCCGGLLLHPDLAFFACQPNRTDHETLQTVQVGAVEH